MSDLIDVQVELYPAILRRMAAGEHLASQQDDTEKLAATLLAAEAIEAERAAQAPVEKKAIDMGLGTLLLGSFAAGPIKKAINKALGNPELPTEGAELIASFRKIMQGQAEAESAKRKMLMIGLGAAGAGALAVKSLEGNQDKAAADERDEKKEDKDEEKKDEKSDKKLPPWLQKKDEKSEEKSEKKDDDKDEDDKKKSKSEKSDDDKKSDKKDEKSEKEEKDEDEKDSADVAVGNNPAGKVAVKTGSPSAHAVLSRLMKSFA
jgi:hypothetical protein